MIRVAVQLEPLDIPAYGAALAVPGGGAIATFTGLVRADDGVEQLELEHYPGITERALTEIATHAGGRWALLAATVVHRVGVMHPGDAIVFVGAAAAHRHAALDACSFMIDRLKTDAPFWKRETVAGSRRWVEARAGDEAAAQRWREP